MNLTRWVTAAVAIVGLLGLMAWMAGSFNTRVMPDTIEPEAADVAGAVAVRLAQVPAFESVPAGLEARQATIVASRILARVEIIKVRAGDLVTRGDELARLESSDLAARVSQADARVASIAARAEEARRNLVRAEDLHSQKVIAAADLDRARAMADSLAADLDNASRSLDEARTALQYATITAPIDGRIVDRFVEPGDTLQPGQPILSLYNPATMRVDANVREALALSLRVGQPVTVSIPALDQTVDAVIEEIVPAGNPGSRSFLVKASVGQTGGLLPGTYAQLHLPTGTVAQLLIPADRILQVGQLEMVLVGNDTGVERRLIRTAGRHDVDMIVISGVDPGELILPP
jgi:membrane fusion protein, multidrug efflux system